jgi:3-mercaptopyruvate sulfurtransferase SseA
VAQQLLDMGLSNVLVLKGGWNGWLKAGYPTEPKK